MSFVSEYNSLVFCLEIVDSRMMSFVHVKDFTLEIGSPDFSFGVLASYVENKTNTALFFTLSKYLSKFQLR